MKSLKTVLDRMKEQNIALEDNEKIVIPVDEFYVELHGETRFGRIFPKEGIIVTLLPCEDGNSETGSINLPYIWKIKNVYETWLSSGSIAYRTEFYVVE